MQTERQDREETNMTGNEPFFTQERSFYRQLFSIFIMVALQNLVAYSVNMIDNVMMGSYSQTSLSGAATVNQIFFLVQQTAISVCDANIILASQYYGQGRMSPVRKIAGVSLKLGLACGLFFAARFSGLNSMGQTPQSPQTTMADQQACRHVTGAMPPACAGT